MTTALRSYERPTPVRAPRPEPRRRPQEHLRTVERPVRPVRRLRPTIVGALVVCVVFGALLAAAVFQSMLVTGQDHLDDTNRQIAAEERALQADRARLAAAQSPERLAVEAARLGMVEPTGRDWVQSGPGSTVDDATDATTSELAAPAGGDTEGTTETR